MSSQHPFAIPTLEPRWPRRMPDVAWGTIISGVLILIIGLLGYAFKEPWLFASLGPTVFIITETPTLSIARFYNTIVAHFVGIAVGILAVYITGAASTPAVDPFGYPVMARVWASVLAIALTMFVVMLLHASHPPAAATTLLFSVGVIEPNWKGAVAVIVGVSIVATLGEMARLLRLGEKPNIRMFLPS